MADLPTPRDDSSALLEVYLKQLNLPTFVHNHAAFAQDAAKANYSFDRFLLALAEQEVLSRDKNRCLRRIHDARFPVLKELADFDFTAVPSLNKALVLDLATHNHYLAKAEPVILVGGPGLGKTHISIALALSACRQGKRVRFYNAATLVNELIAAQDKHQTERFIASALKHHLIVLDELGFIPFTHSGAQLLFQFCSALHERVPLIVNTNLKFADWVQVLLNETMTAALLDRLTHRAHILEFAGAESYRFKQRTRRSTRQEVNA
jgi:DNA replication protein DnaC